MMLRDQPRPALRRRAAIVFTTEETAMFANNGHPAVTVLLAVSMFLAASAPARAQCRGGQRGGGSMTPAMLRSQPQGVMLAALPQQQNPVLAAAMQRQYAMMAAIQQQYAPAGAVTPPQYALLVALPQQDSTPAADAPQVALLLVWPEQQYALLVALPQQQDDPSPADGEQGQEDARLRTAQAPRP
jgi:hypothetical protein